jgi:hypothetical protein
MIKKIPMAGLCLSLMIIGSLAQAADIPVIRLDENGNPVQVKMNGKDYSDRLKATLHTMHDSTLPALHNTEANSGWGLRTVLVGVGVNAVWGIGKLVQFGANPRVRLLFTNSTDPQLP